MSAKYVIQCAKHDQIGTISSDLQLLSKSDISEAEEWLERCKEVADHFFKLMDCDFVIVEFDDADYPDEVQDNG